MAVVTTWVRNKSPRLAQTYLCTMLIVLMSAIGDKSTVDTVLKKRACEGSCMPSYCVCENMRCKLSFQCSQNTLKAFCLCCKIQCLEPLDLHYKEWKGSNVCLDRLLLLIKPCSILISVVQHITLNELIYDPNIETKNWGSLEKMLRQVQTYLYSLWHLSESLKSLLKAHRLTLPALQIINLDEKSNPILARQQHVPTVTLSICGSFLRYHKTCWAILVPGLRDNECKHLIKLMDVPRSVHI